MRLRFAWNGGSPRVWNGVIRANGARFAEVHSLAAESNSAASCIVADDRIYIQSESAHTGEILDATITADVDAILVVELQIDGVSRTVLEAPLHQLARESVTATADGAPRITVARTPGDRLQVEFEHSSMVFDPGTTCAFKVRPHLVGQSGNALKLKAVLVSQPGEQKLWSQEVDVRLPSDDALTDSVSLTLTLPESEGVYELWISAINSGLKERLPWKKPLTERRVQLVVVGNTAPAEGAASALTKVLEIDPASPKWWDRLSASLPLSPSLRRWNLSGGESAKWDHPRLGTLVQLNPIVSEERPSWEAFPLPTTTPGAPHIVEVEYPADVPQTIGLSVVELAAGGGVWSTCADSGLYVPDEDADQPPALLKHRLVYWPRSKTPLLLVTNRRPGAPAVLGKIRVFSTAAVPLAALNLGKAATVATLPPAVPSQVAGERLVAALMERPSFLRSWGTDEPVPGLPDAASSWRGVQAASSHLVEYLRFSGYGGVVLGAAVDGATIYPSERLASTARYDAGLLSHAGHDPVQKDILELLFRLFDREQLTLIPLLDLNSPILELEELRRDDTGRLGVAWITSAGLKTEPRSISPDGGPRYNPLNPRVQQALLGSVREISQRYGHHRSFGGLAIQFGPGRCVQLSSADGGFDDDTTARFQRATSRRIPGNGENRFIQRAQYLLNDARAEWLAWRADALYGLHQQMLAELRGVNSDARMFLSLPHCFEIPAAQTALRPALPPQSRPEEVLLEQGLRLDLYRRQPGFVLLRPSDATPVHSLVADAVKVEINLANELDRLFGQQRAPAAVCYHGTHRSSVLLPEQHGLWESGSTETPLASIFPPSGDRTRQRLVHALAMLDADVLVSGGDGPALGQEEHLRDLLLSVRQLPAARFELVSSESQPVVVRTLSRDQSTYAYVVNDSPWQATLSLSVEMPNGCRLERLGTNRQMPPLARSGEAWSWTVGLRPYDMLAVRFNAPRVRLSRPRITLGENVQLALQRRIADLGSRVAALANPSALDVPANSGFEVESKGGIPGWIVDDSSEGIATADAASEPHSGIRSLKLISSGRQAIVRSDPFPAPTTGRLGMQVWLRAGKLPASTKLILAMEGAATAKPLQRYAVLGGDEPDAVRISDRWAPYVVQVGDLPDADAGNLNLRLELAGPGEVNIDDVRLFDLPFNEIEQVELTKIVSLANFKLQAGQVSDCERILDGFWPTFLVAHVPLTEGPTTLAQRTRKSTGSRDAMHATTGKRLGVFDRVREFVPRFKPKSGGKSN